MDDLVVDEGARLRYILEALNTDDVAEELRAALTEQKRSALEELLTMCDNLDIAADFFRLEGAVGKLIDHATAHTDSGVRALSLEAIGTCVQNTEKLQEQALGVGVLPVLVMLIQDNSLADKEKEKAIFALGSLIRSFPPAYAPFVAAAGFKCLSAVLDGGCTNASRKALFLLRHLCYAEASETASAETVAESCLQSGLVPKLMSRQLLLHDDFQVREFTRLLLVRLVEQPAVKAVAAESALVAVLKEQKGALDNRVVSLVQEKLERRTDADGDENTDDIENVEEELAAVGSLLAAP
jgi:hypothetical protein